MSDSSTRVHDLPNNTFLVLTSAYPVLVNCPPETLKYLLAAGFKVPQHILIGPDAPAGSQLGSSGFVHQGINYASVEFLIYANFFGAGGRRTQIMTTTRRQAARLRRILEETMDGPRDPAEYPPFAWLPAECAAVGFFPPLGRAPLASDLVDLTSLEDGGQFGDLHIEVQDDHLIFTEAGRQVAAVPVALHGTPSPLRLAPARPLQRQELTVQFIGGSDGFDPAGITTCFLAYLGRTADTQATLFDAAAYLRLRLGNLGLSPRQISEVVLSHLHEDHLAGLPELLLMGQHRVRLLTSNIIYRSLLRVLGAMLDISETEAATLFDHYPLNPGQPIELEGRRFESIYAVHSIPTIAVRANGLCYSGDMRYDEEWFADLEARGVLSPQRRQELVHFFDDARILVQDAGGGAVHSTITPALLKSLTAKSQKVILAHTSKHLLPQDDPDLLERIEFASSGHVSALGQAMEPAAETEPLETLSACSLYARLPLARRQALAALAQVTAWADGAVITVEGDPSDGATHVVHSGLVEVWAEGELRQLMSRGNSLGERGALMGETRTSTLTARGPVQLLTFTRQVFLPFAEELGLVSAFSRAEWLWHQPAFNRLPWATLLDLALDFQPRAAVAGASLFDYGEPGGECYMLIHGAIDLRDENGRLLETLDQPGSLFGARSALYKQPRNAAASAARPCEFWALPAAALQRLQMIYPNVLLHLRVIEAGHAGRRAAA